MSDDNLRSRMETFNEQFAEARMCLSDARESLNTSYFKDDILEALEQVGITEDLYKALLEELGEVHFGEMCMKPGKPTTFATVPAPPTAGGSQRPRLVFALPGNPVSCFVTFKLLVAPAIERLRGRPCGAALYPRVDAELAQAVEMDPVRPEYHRAVARWEGGRILAESTGFQRSSRVASVAAANCFLEIPRMAGILPKGTVVPALLLSSSGDAGLSAEPSGYPRPGEIIAKAAAVQTPPPLLPAKAVPASAVGNVAAPRTGRSIRRVGILAVGKEGAVGAQEALDYLKAAGLQEDTEQLLRISLPAEGAAGAAQATLEAWAPADAGVEGLVDLALLLGDLSLAEEGAALADAVRAVLSKDAPGVVDAVLRAALSRTPLAALEQPVAGVRGRCLVAAIPACAAAEGVRVVWPLLDAHGRDLPSLA